MTFFHEIFLSYRNLRITSIATKTSPSQENMCFARIILFVEILISKNMIPRIPGHSAQLLGSIGIFRVFFRVLLGYALINNSRRPVLPAKTHQIRFNLYVNDNCGF